MNALADFLNHGTLPFTGRDAELRRILDFWQGVFDARELRVMVMFGEAGVGKSRLLEHAVRAIAESRGSVVHVKIYPESTTPFLALVTRALMHPNAGGALFSEEPEPMPGAVGAAMQRLSRLRPTLLILEDLHLLAGDAISDLSRMLQLLTDETISVLAVARPVELEARAALEPYLIEELRLHGLEREACAMIWEEVSGAVLQPEVSATLHEVTAGNPLALRAALREAFRMRDGLRSDGANVVPAAATPGAIARTLQRSVELLAEGMTAHLEEEEVLAAERLACLGEVFSREAAEIVLEDSRELLDALLFKGVIARAVAPPEPLTEHGGSSAPLGFTHTLLHRQLIDRLDCDAGRLVRAIADAPLYSILPFRLLVECPWGAPGLECDTIARAFDRTIRVQVALNHSPQWRHADRTWGVALRLLAWRMGQWERPEWERMLVRLASHRLNMMRREPLEVRLRWLHYLESLTADPVSDELAVGRLFALFHRDLMHSATDPEISDRLWEEAERLTDNRPHLRTTIAYADYVVAASVGAQGRRNIGLLRRIEARAEQLLATGDLPERVRMIYERKVRPPLLTLYESEEEQRVRLDTVARFERTVPIGDLNVWTFCVNLLAEAAMVDALDRLCEAIIPAIRKQGMTDLLVDAVAQRQGVLAGASDSFDDVLAPFERALDEMPQWRRVQVQHLVALPLIDAALISSQLERALELIRRYGVADEALSMIQRMALALDADEPRGALLALYDHGDASELAPLLALALDRGAPDHAAVRKLLRRPPLRLADILAVRTIVRAIELGDHAGADLRGDIGGALVAALEWLGAPERGLYAYMRPLLEQARPYLPARESTSWMKRIEGCAAAWRERRAPTADAGALRLSMLGTISATMRDGRVQRFQGARARMLLATMVINEMMSAPLSSAEFCRQAAGGEAIEIENARDVVKTTIHRVRELIGYDAILTSGATPRLNPALVEVDLLAAHSLLKRAAEMLRSASPMQATAALGAALDIMRGEVPFPSLYDDFVEAMREDLETMVRATAIDIARVLLREGGAADAAALLHRVGDVLPGDEELAQLLHDALRRAGKRTDAVRALRGTTE